MEIRTSTMQTLADRTRWFGELQAYVVTAASDLFAAYGMPVVHGLPDGADKPGSAVMAVLGFGAEHMRGSVLLLTSRSVARALEPEELRQSSVAQDILLRDVLGEFANMLLGRVKNQLATRGLAPMLAIPIAIVGDDLSLPAPRSGQSAWHSFAGEAGEIHVRLDVTFEPLFTLPPVRPTADEAVREGEMVFFSEDAE